MTFTLWLYVAMRVMMCITAGEVAIRYLAWTIALRGRHLMAAPIVTAVAALAFFRFGVEGRWAVLLLEPDTAATFTAIDDNDPISQFFRLGHVIAFIALTAVVTIIEYHTTKGRAVVEAIVRVFIAVAAFVAGCVFMTLYTYHV